MKFCDTTLGTRVAYEPTQNGNSMPLVLLHGFCEDQSVWSPILQQLQPHTLILVDLPGFGASDLMPQANMESYAAAVASVLDAEGIDRCVLVGHSLGGYVGLEFAARWPGRLAGLGLFHSHPFEDTEERKTARRRGIETLQAGKRDLYVAQLFPNLFGADFLQKNPAVLQFLVETGKKQSPQGIIAALQAMIGRRDHQATLVALACPVLFLLGAQDTLVPAQQGLQAALLPAFADLQLLSAVAHMGMWEAPEESAKILNSFWDICHS